MKTTRNPWPIGICAAFALFALGTACLVAMACSQKVELVSVDYYEQELRFQGQIERTKRAAKLGNEASVGYDRSNKAIKISLPAGQAIQGLKGHIKLYRPSAGGLDQDLPLEVNQNGSQALDASHLRRGLWKIRVSWTAEGQDYFIEQKLVIGS
jgi:nitrogen fixation protein FixH